MVAAAGLLSIMGTLLAYGGYTFINLISKNITSTLNKTQDNIVLSHEFINLLDNTTLSMNISQISGDMENLIKQVENTNVSMELNEFNQTGLLQNYSIIEDTENLIKEVVNTHESMELNEFNQTGLLQNYSNTILNFAESILPLGRELPDTNELITSNSNQDPDQNQNPTVYPHKLDADLSGQELNDIEYDGQLNPKLILTTNNNNENNLKISEKEELIVKKLFDFEPFPSNKLPNKQKIDNIPQNSLFGTNHLETIGTKLKNPFFPTHDTEDHVQNDLLDLNEIDIQSHKEKVYTFHENEDTFQDDLLDLNEIDIQSYKEKVNPKLSIKFNTNLDSNAENMAKDETIQNNETDSVVNDYLETDINTMESNNLDNLDYNKVKVLEKEVSVIGDLIDSLVSVQESENVENEILSNEVKKSFIGNTENSGENDEAKALLMTYAEIAGIVVGAVLIVTGLIFLSVRQALKHRRDVKVKRRYAETKVNQIGSLTYAYTNNIEG